MQKLLTFLFILLISLSIFSCKNEGKDSKNVAPEKVMVDTVAKIPTKRAQKKDLTEQDIAEIKSVMSKMMTEPQLKKYTSYVVTAEIADQLTNEEGPYTVFAPSNNAIDKIDSIILKDYSKSENKAKLVEMLSSHIIVSKMDSETLMQKVAKSGKIKLKTLAGNTLTATKSGEQIIISDGKGTRATILKGSIDGSNGVIYVIDGVFGTN